MKKKFCIRENTNFSTNAEKSTDPQINLFWGDVLWWNKKIGDIFLFVLAVVIVGEGEAGGGEGTKATIPRETVPRGWPSKTAYESKRNNTGLMDIST